MNRLSVITALLLASAPLWSETSGKRHRRSSVPIPKSLGTKPEGAKKPGAKPLSASPGHPRATDLPSVGTAAPSGTAAFAPPPVVKKRVKPGADSCTTRHSIESFMQISAAHSPQASPQGGVYFLSDLREVNQVYFAESPQGWPRQITYFNDGVAYFRLSPDGKFLLAATDVGGDEQYDIHLYDIQNETTTALLVGRKARVESVSWAPNSKSFYFTSNPRNGIDMDLFQFDFATKKPSFFTQLEGMNRVTDVSPQGTFIALESVRSVIDSDVIVVDTKSREATIPTSHSGHRVNRSPRFTNDGQGILYLSDEDRETAQLFTLRLGQLEKRVALTSEVGEVEDLSLDRGRTQIALVVNDKGYGTLTGLRLTDAGAKAGKLGLPNTGRSVVRSPSFGFGKQRKTLFFARSEPRATWDIWYWNESAVVPWTRSPFGGLNEDCLVDAELVSFPSFDKLEIPGFLYRPLAAEGPVPFIVSVHGGPEGQSRPVFNRLNQYFLERGFGVFLPNIRGSTGYGKRYVSLDDYKKRMDSVEDVIEGGKWLVLKGYAPAERLAIQGGSYGGFLVLRTIEKEPKLFAAAAESVGITNFVTFLKNTSPYRRVLREVEYGPLEDPAFLTSISPMTYIDQIKTPLIIFHGANDPRVPVSETEQVVKALKEKDVPVEFKVFADEGHGNAKLKNQLEQARLTAYFFDKQLNRPELIKRDE